MGSLDPGSPETGIQSSPPAFVPASANPQPASDDSLNQAADQHTNDTPLRLRGEIEAIEAAALQPAATALALEDHLSTAIRLVLNIDFRRYDADRHRAAAPALIQQIFTFQQRLRSMIADWHARSLMSINNQRLVRNLLRMSRYAADILGEMWAGFERLPDDGLTKRAFTGEDYNTLVANNYAGVDPLPFQSGDVIVVRSRFHNSAAIARIGDTDSQFAHVFMVHIDRDGKHWAVEALIADGSIVRPLSEAIAPGLGRAICLRHNNATLAKNAATIIADRIRFSNSTLGRHIPYDFTMRPGVGRNLFCSKLIRRAFKEASEQALILPTFPTKLTMKNRDFVDRIGVRTTETFAPGDMEIEPDFHLVAEWQDYRVTSDMRLQDMIMDKLFEWMETKDYRFKETWKIRLISLFGRASSYLARDIKRMIEDVIPRVPTNMSRRAIAALTMLHETAQPLLQELRNAEADSIRQTGLPLHPRDAYQI
ncbi:MAG: YiiX/YebB-like N1pC/P60 family cysteine hydrolase, partial [Pseudomonadota bacterium]